MGLLINKKFIVTSFFHHTVLDTKIIEAKTIKEARFKFLIKDPVLENKLITGDKRFWLGYKRIR
jgi:hypothetical protein